VTPTAALFTIEGLLRQRGIHDLADEVHRLTRQMIGSRDRSLPVELPRRARRSTQRTALRAWQFAA